jgi:hypothetical protein
MAATIGLALAAPAEAQDALAPELEAFRPFIGKTWRSVPPAESEKPVVDVSRWERALNGRAIRVLHSINDGEYGGESIVYWEAERKVLAYAYFTTAGHNTAGTFTVQDGALIGNEKVSGEANGVTEVRSTTRLLPDGRMHMKAEYLQKDAWVPGHEFFYVEDPSASVVFK